MNNEGYKKEKHIYWKLFLSTFQISAFTFGGGFVIIALMKKKFVEKFKWIEEEEMLDLTAIAQSTPGAIAVNASILVGYKVAGLRGALMTVLGTILPPMIIASIISVFYAEFRDSVIVSLVMAGMLAAVAAIIFDVVFSMAGGVFKQKRFLPVVIMFGAFGAAFFAGVNIMLILLFCGVIGVIDTLRADRKKKQQEKGAEV